MRSVPARSLLTVAVTTALAVSTLTALSASAEAATRHGTPAAASQPATPAGSASGFLFYVYPDPQPTCSTLSPVGLNASDDPSVDRNACAFVRFTGSNLKNPVKADFYAGDAEQPFTSSSASASSTTPGSYTVDVTPDADWPSGKIHMVVTDADGAVGSFDFAHNTLVATVDTGQATRPGDPFTVTGTISEHSARASFQPQDVPADFTLDVADAEGHELWSKDVTAADDGTFSETVPGGVTDSITSDQSLSVSIEDASYTDDEPVTGSGDWAAATAGSTGHGVAVPADSLELVNSFVSSVGWVKPGDTYPSRIIVTNPTDDTVSGATVDLTAPEGSTFLTADDAPVADPHSHQWSVPSLAPGEEAVLVLTSQAATTEELATIVWRDLSSTAVLHEGGTDTESVSRGPKVIPPNARFDTARYGDRPFPVVPLQYTDRSYQASHSGDSLESVINDPGNPGSTYNLYQEMSLGQLFPEGTVPSKGVGSAGFNDFDPAFPFTSVTDGTPNTCRGFTWADAGGTANPLYSERITNGVYNLPGNTDYYGDDANGSAVVGSVSGQGALQQIDSGCGPTGKVVADAVALADPEIDYSDYDTDKDGVVDFFMGVFAGCGGNGASQLGPLGCDYADNPPGTDNIWPHSSSLEYYYNDPDTGLPGVVTNDQLKNPKGQPLCWQDEAFTQKGVDCSGGKKPVMVRVGPYNLNPETAIDKASVISHEYGHSLGLPDFYSTGSRETYGDWTLMATDKSQNIDAYGRQELGWVVPEVLDGDTTVEDWTDSKQDTGTIHWQTEDGTPYTLNDGEDGTVHNSQMYVAKLPGRQLLDASAFEQTDTSEGASPRHLWWSGSGNDFGCPPQGGRNFDLAVPGAASLPAGSTIDLSFKSRWDIEWDYDYGFVMTTTDGGKTYSSHESEKGYTTENTDPTEGNPNQNGCQQQYDHGITGSSGSYQANSQVTDRKTGDTPAPVFLTDSYDISALAGQPNGALRFSYATDPGLARPGWFIDDVKVTATLPGGETRDLLVTDFETSGGPDDPSVYNGGCRGDLTTAQQCTIGWKYLEAGAESAQDHAYYLEMRDRSGFDEEGHGQIDRDPIGFEPGLYLSYTDEAHGYGNAGTDDPPAQSPLDSTPQPGSETPNLNDAAFTTDAARSSYSDGGDGHTDNYTDPSSDSGNWEFDYDCLGFEVLSLSGTDVGPSQPDQPGPTGENLTGDVEFTLGPGCGTFDYGYDEGAPSGGGNTAPEASFTGPGKARTGQERTFDAGGTTDAETPDDLDYSWDFGDGGSTKDATGKVVDHTFTEPGIHTVTLTVTDPAGLSDTVSSEVEVRRFLGCNRPRVDRNGSWRVVRSEEAPHGAYCDTKGERSGPDTVVLRFKGPRLVVVHAAARSGGRAAVFIDGERKPDLVFHGSSDRLRFGKKHGYDHLGEGKHKVRIVMEKKTGYLEGFVLRR